MAVEITVPRLGWSMEEGLFAGWLAQPGARVSAGDPLFALESDKITMDVESLDAGILFVPPNAPVTGDAVVVGQRLGYLLAPGEAAPEGGAVTQASAPTVVTPPALEKPVSQEREGRLTITPRARRTALELGVDTSQLLGSGRGGRIREVDVRAAQPSSQPITTMRRAIARHMIESRQNTAPVTLTCRADATALVALRREWREASNPGAGPSYTDIFVKLAAIALESHPLLGARWEEDRLVLPNLIHIGIAVDTPLGLVTPVLRDAGTVPLAELARRSRALIEAAHAHRLRAEDLTGGTFTISNLGAFGIDAFTPILNYPETAMLGLGQIRKEAVVLGSGEVAARDQITLSLTFDHRVVDGAPAARFLQSLVRLLADPPPEAHCR